MANHGEDSQKQIEIANRLREQEKKLAHTNEHKEMWLAIDLLYASVNKMVQYNERRMQEGNVTDRERNRWQRKAREIIPCMEKVQEIKDKYLQRR